MSEIIVEIFHLCCWLHPQTNHQRLNCYIVVAKLLYNAVNLVPSILWCFDRKWGRERVARCSLILKPHCATLEKGEGNYSRQFAAISGTSCNHTALSGNGGGSSLPDLHLHCHAVPLSSERNLPQPLPPFITRRFFTITMMTQCYHQIHSLKSSPLPSLPPGFFTITMLTSTIIRVIHCPLHFAILHHQSFFAINYWAWTLTKERHVVISLPLPPCLIHHMSLHMTVALAPSLLVISPLPSSFDTRLLPWSTLRVGFLFCPRPLDCLQGQLA